MEVESPSNAVLATKIEAISDVILANTTVNREAHAAILLQVTNTNGSIAEAKKDIADLNRWRYMMVGAISVIAVVLGWVVSLAIKKL